MSFSNLVCCRSLGLARENVACGQWVELVGEEVLPDLCGTPTGVVGAVVLTSCTETANNVL